MGHVTGVRLYKTQSSSIYLVLWESYCVVFKTPNLWLSNFSEPLEVPDEVPGVQLSRFEWLKMPGRAWFQWGWKTLGFFSRLCLAQVTSINWSQRTSVSILSMGRVHLAPQLCQSLTCVINSLPVNFPENESKSYIRAEKLEEVTWLSTAALAYR